MRVPSIVLFVLAIAVVSSSGCKVRGKNGLAAKRPVSRGLFRSSRDRSLAQIDNSLATRGTAECDCYTCRMRRQESDAYIVESVEPGVEVFEQPVSTFDNSPIEPDVVTPNLVPDSQEIQGTLIPDSELTNELPAEPSNEFVPTIPSQPEIQPEPTLEVQPLLISPKTSMNLHEAVEEEIEEEQETPLVQSAPIKAETVSARINKTPADEEPTVDNSVFRLGNRNDSVLEVEVAPIAPRRDETIWFAPGQEPKPEPAPKTEPAPVRSNPSPRVVPQEASAPMIEHEIKEIAPIVLTARPVDRHMIYNSRQPTHAPVREARLTTTTDSRFVPPHRQRHNTQLQFYPLPPQQPSRVSPAPVAPVLVPKVPVNPQPLANPQSSTPLFTPVPQQEDDSALLRLRATVAPTANQVNGSRLLDPPMAQVIPKSSSLLKLNAAPTGDEPHSLPAIVKIRARNQGRVVVGSLQSPHEGTQQSTTAGMNRLHTTPWQPMETGRNGSGQVQQSIRQLMIRPQQEANFATDGLHR